MVEPISACGQFEIQDYYQHPEKYRSRMEQYLPYLTVLLNCIYWTPKYPRILTKDFAKTLFSGKTLPTLRVIGDISCDIGGAIECTAQVAEPDNPVFVYHPDTNESIPGYEGKGIVTMAVDNLPCELARESSETFSHVLRDYVPALVEADYSRNFEECNLPEVLKKAMILYHGELTKNYTYIEKYL
jgi:alpha-aminoadipic semialdehyde synthase